MQPLCDTNESDSITGTHSSTRIWFRMQQNISDHKTKTYGVCVLSHSVVSDSLQSHDCRLPRPSVHGLLQTRILEWVGIPFPRGSSQPSDQTQVSRIAGRFFTSWATREAQMGALGNLMKPMNLLAIILHARLLEWVASPFSRGPSLPSNWTRVSHIAGRFFTIWAI